jgi:hypothetical protein
MYPLKRKFFCPGFIFCKKNVIKEFCLHIFIRNL